MKSEEVIRQSLAMVNHFLDAMKGLRIPLTEHQYWTNQKEFLLWVLEDDN